MPACLYERRNGTLLKWEIRSRDTTHHPSFLSGCWVFYVLSGGGKGRYLMFILEVWSERKVVRYSRDLGICKLPRIVTEFVVGDYVINRAAYP